MRVEVGQGTMEVGLWLNGNELPKAGEVEAGCTAVAGRGESGRWSHNRKGPQFRSG